MSSSRWFAIPLVLASLALAACSDSTGARAPGQVAVRFGVTSGARADRVPGGILAAAGGPLVITGTNGTLSITGIHVVVSRFRLKGTEAAPCSTSVRRDDGNGGGGENEHEVENEDGCEFEAGPFFLDVPLDGSQLTIATGTVPPGTFNQAAFKIKNLDFRDDDDHEDDDAAGQQAISTLFSQIRAQFPNWPANASMLVTGTFTPTGGTARNVNAFLDAEVKVRVPINPPLTVGDGSSTNSVSLLIDPSTFFKVGGNVIDLSQFNGTVGHFEAEAENGFHCEGHHGDR